MPTTADRDGRPRPEDAGATSRGVAAGPIESEGPPARLLRFARGLRAGRDAATTVEYALMLLLVSSLCLAMTAMATSLTGALGRAASFLH